ncbi:MAG TPA: sensor histidine kinase [Symbiobacteriaceae bacterium]|nr:sensor histidine kinase [Symbiobacteriaceae bacterium]
MQVQRRDPTRIFMWFTYAFLVLVWVVTVKEPEFRTAGRMIPFTALLLVHGYLHGTIHRWMGRLKAPLYFAAQTVLAVALVMLADGEVMTSALFFPLAGEVFGLFEDPARRIACVAGLVVAWGLSGMATAGVSMMRIQLPGAVLGLAFVGIYVTLFTRQMRERERAEKLLTELAEAHGKLKAYALKVEELSITQERQRMARELHDTLAQGLAGLIMQLEAIDDLLERGDAERARTITARAMQRARTTLQEARTAIVALRSPLEQGDVMEAIRRLVDNLTADTGIACAFEAGPGDLRLGGHVAETVYRVVQEGLVNIARHSGARRAWVRLSAAGGEIRLEVGDDGVGFDPPSRPIQPGHFGLTGLHERTALAGGKLILHSAPGAGTRLVVTLPLREEQTP